MSANCPDPPRTPSSIGIKLHELPIGTRLVRFHSPHFAALSFNPNLDSAGAPRRMEIKEDGSRFNPFPDDAGTNISTLYAGTTEHAAALESVFHDLPHIPNPEFPTSKLSHFVLSRFKVTRPLRVLELVNSQLRQVTVPGRSESLTEAEIIHSDPMQYPVTRRWAQYLYNSFPDLHGFAWRPRLGGEGLAYVFFGDRIGAATAFEVEAPPVPISTGSGYDLIREIAADAYIELVTTNR